jgi:hypothetical protein
MTQVENFGIGEDAFELLSQTGFHLFFIDEDTVLRQAAGLDVTVEQYDPMSGFRELPSAVKPCWSSAHDSD